MRKLTWVTVAVAMLVPVAAHSQETPRRAPENGQNLPIKKARTAEAVVGADGKSFVDHKSTQWSVANPEALDGFRNQRVKVKYLLLSSDMNQARVVSVKLVPVFVQYSGYKSDSAFHR